MWYYKSIPMIDDHSMIDRSSITVFGSFDEADQADKQERWDLAQDERLLILERLRSYQYPDGETAPRLQRLLESAEFPLR